MFEWDDDKANANFLKHGVTFQEAQTVFEDVMALTFVDSDHSQIEDRFVTLGVSSEAHLILVVNTERGENIRIISARKANPTERKTYENRF